MSEPLLEIERLSKYFPVMKGLLWGKIAGWVRAVDEISFSIRKGETFVLVGESGCGKTTTAKLVLRLIIPTGGSIRFQGKNLFELRRDKLKEYRRLVQSVSQDPYSSLNPRLRVGSIIAEPMVANSTMSPGSIQERVQNLLVQVGLPPKASNLYPHEFSGGQRQRIALARSLALKPKVIVLDEPVSALDVSIGAQIMNLLKDIQQQSGVSYLLIVHNLATARYMSHRIAIMYLGKIVELASTEDLFTKPLHPYTQALLSAALPSHPDLKREEIVLRGEVPSPIHVPPGCRFHPRCFIGQKICSDEVPFLKEVEAGHWLACHFGVKRPESEH